MLRSAVRSFGFVLSGFLLAACTAPDELTGSYAYAKNPRATLSIGGGIMTAGGGPNTISATYRIVSKVETPASTRRPQHLTFRVTLSMPGMSPGEVTMTLTDKVLAVENAFYAFGGTWVKQ